MDLKELLAILWKRRLLVMVVVALTGLLSLAFAQSRDEQYESTSTIAFTPRFDQGVGFIGPDTLDALLGTYAQTAKSSVTLDRASRDIAGGLPGSVDTSTEPGTGILRIIGRAGDPADAALTARAVTETFIDSLSSNTLFQTEIVDPAIQSSTPVQPRPPLIVAVGLLLGLLGGAMLAYVVDQFRRRIESGADVAEFTPAPVIGRLPRYRGLGRRASTVVWEDERLTALQEAFRGLRTNVEVLTKANGTILQITSPLPQQGKSTVVANLGVALAQVGVQTLIVDADLRRPVQHVIFGVDNSVGLSTLMASPGAELRTVPTIYPHLSLIPSGPLPPHSTEMLHIRFGTVMEHLRKHKGMVLLDTPPILPVSDARLISSQVDGVLLVIAAGQQKPATLRSTIEKLEFAGAPLLGTVLNFSGEELEAGGYDYYTAAGSSSQAPVVPSTLVR
jgi:capsular exopolysaccharide synthesis family protein